jgi:hypothetical protein
LKCCLRKYRISPKKARIRSLLDSSTLSLSILPPLWLGLAGIVGASGVFRSDDGVEVDTLARLDGDEDVGGVVVRFCDVARDVCEVEDWVVGSDD